ncbi:MAG TPA: tripartite tricarboxylate transporter substrate binding protein, partial [Burkholderiales bacterium]|nr:tripartite tricarboxylate transporter substrate binding protein [Burkholderiales bacterium]
DFVGRIIAEALGKRLGQQFVVDNRAGASGIIATEITAKAPPDGYTLLLVTTSFGVNPGLYKKLPYDPLHDLAPITHLAHAPQILVVHPGVRVQSVKDLIALARAKPGELNYGVSSIAGATQLAAELFNLMANVKITQIPYKGAPAMLVDLMGARIDLSFATMPSSMAHVRSGKLRGIAVTGAKRSALVPELPTIAENGLPGYEMVAWQGLLAPRATPAALIQLIHRETVAVINQPEARKQLAAEGGEAVGNTPEEFARWIRTEIAKWTKVVKDANIRVE